MKIGEIPEGQGDESTYGLFAWNCERGAEMTTGGAIQFHNFIGSDNWVAGISGKETFLNTYGLGDTMAFVRSIAIGRSMAHPELEKCGEMGIETPWEEFAFTVHDIHFFNYDEPGLVLVTPTILAMVLMHSIVPLIHGSLMSDGQTQRERLQLPGSTNMH